MPLSASHGEWRVELFRSSDSPLTSSHPTQWKRTVQPLLSRRDSRARVKLYNTDLPGQSLYWNFIEERGFVRGIIRSLPKPPGIVKLERLYHRQRRRHVCKPKSSSPTRSFKLLTCLPAVSLLFSAWSDQTPRVILLHACLGECKSLILAAATAV